MEMLIKMYQDFNNLLQCPMPQKVLIHTSFWNWNKGKIKDKTIWKGNMKDQKPATAQTQEVTIFNKFLTKPSQASCYLSISRQGRWSRKVQFPEVSLHLVCVPAWQASLMWGQGLKKPPKTSLWATQCFPPSGLWGTSHGWSTTVLRFQLLIDYGAASTSSWMRQQHLDSRKTQHLPSSQQRAELLIKQPCLLKALCVLAQQCFITSAQQTQQAGGIYELTPSMSPMKIPNPQRLKKK